MRRAHFLAVGLVGFAAACGSDRGTAASAADAGASDASTDAEVADAGPGMGGDAAAADASDADAPVPLPAVPFHTESRWIMDAGGKRVKLASVNWYGAEEKDFVVAGLDFADIHAIAKFIRASGMNSVRLPWSNEMLETNPVIAFERLAANPALQGKRAMEIFDAVIAALAHEGLVVILDNHTSRADWCCSLTDGNGLWHRAGYPESAWLADWTTIVTRYKSQPAVVAADLRNELRQSADGAPVWGGGDPNLDWHAAAERGGKAVLAANPDLLVVVEGINYSLDFTAVGALPVDLGVAGRLVYSPHDYVQSQPAQPSYASLKTLLGNNWGYLLAQGHPYTAPIWVGEFGTAHDAQDVSASQGAGFWFQSFRQYLVDADIDWAYWALNGTQATGTSRTLGAEETYGIMNVTWSTSASKDLLDALRALEPATQFP